MQDNKKTKTKLNTFMSIIPLSIIISHQCHWQLHFIFISHTYLFLFFFLFWYISLTRLYLYNYFTFPMKFMKQNHKYERTSIKSLQGIAWKTQQRRLSQPILLKPLPCILKVVKINFVHITLQTSSERILRYTHEEAVTRTHIHTQAIENKSVTKSRNHYRNYSP